MAIRKSFRIPVAISLAAIIAGGLALAPSLPAAAASDDILVSSDGVHFAPQLASSLFQNLGWLVPMESQHVSMWITNNSDYSATMRVAVNDLVVPSAVFAQGVTLTSAGPRKSYDQSWTFGQLQTCKTVVPSATIKSGETIKVDLTVSMLNMRGISAQTESAVLDLAVKMSDLRGGSYSNDPCDDRIIRSSDENTDPTTSPADPSTPGSPGSPDVAGGGDLPFTGQGIRSDLIIAAAVLIGVGWFLLVLRRRRREDEADDATLVP